MSYVPTRYGNVWSATHGVGRPLVVLHGNTMTAASQERLIKHFLDEHQVLSIDLLGHGKSARPEKLFSVRYFAMQGEALLDVLHAKFPNTAVPVFGMSAGAIAILNAVCDDTRHIAAMILDSGFQDVQQETLHAHHHTIQTMSPAWERYLQTQHGDEWWPQLQAGLLRTIEELAARSTRVAPCLSSVNIPTIVFQGGRDHFCSEEQGRAIASTIPNARLIYDSQAGHILAWRYPVVFREIVRDFLRSL